MISIEHNRLNDVLLGSEKKDINIDYIKANDILLEFDKSDRVITISVRMQDAFGLHGQEINFENLEEFLIKENPLVDHEFYIFEKYNLSLYIDFRKEKFLEILIYDKSLKEQYEGRAFYHYNEKGVIVSNKVDSEIFYPYKSIGGLKFGMSEEMFRHDLNINFAPGIGVGGKKIYQLHNKVVRFDQLKLTQIHLARPEISILLDDLDLSLSKDLGKILKKHHFWKADLIIFLKV